MEHSNISLIEMTHINIDVKLEPFHEDYDFTQNVDPLLPDINVKTKIEVLQDFKMEIQVDCNDQATEEDVFKYDQDNNDIKIEELDIKTKCFGNEALYATLDTCTIIQETTHKHTEHGSVQIQKQADENNHTRYELSHSCEPQRCDVTNDGSSLNVTSPANHTRARSDTCSSGIDVLGVHKHSTSEKEGSKQSTSLIAHSLPHPSYVCDVCDMEFKNSRNLVGHKVVHTNQKSHVCDVCKKGFSRLFALARHRRIHTGQKPYVCDVCKKGFSQSSTLATHKRIHTGQKPFVCDICKKGFNYSSAVVTHKRIHTGQKPYVCDICKKRFNSSSYLVTHKRIHTGQKPYVCDICRKGFSSSSALATHKRIHTGQKPFVCDTCKKGFSDSSALVKHKRMHTGEKPYFCEICKKGFSQSCNLASHKCTHTGQKPCV